MPISRESALQILKYLLENPSFYFPFLVMCKGYASYSDGDNDFVEIIPKDDYVNLLDSEEYDTFELWENLQSLDEETLRLMSKGFLEKITSSSLESELQELAVNWRNKWKRELCESVDIEKFG